VPNPNLNRLIAKRLTGAELFHASGHSAGFDVLDFWRWSTSDLVLNITRGVLAEYIVARTLGVPTDSVRDPWRAFDLRTGDGIRVEVKSAAYIQSWAQERFSDIQFTVAKRRGWDADTNVTDAEPRRHADVYVFALLAHREKATIESLDLSQWRFWAVPTKALDDRTRSQDSITLNSLKSLAGDPVDYDHVRDAVYRAAGRGNGDGT